MTAVCIPTNESTQWVPKGKRQRRGRPRKRWRNDLDAYQKCWFEVAMERDKCEELGGNLYQAVGQNGLIKKKPRQNFPKAQVSVSKCTLK